jgi:hypothetical protein
VPRTHYQLLGVANTATRAEIDAGLTRRENQYRDLVRTGQRPDQRIIERVRNAHATLVDPDERAAYDRKLARAARRAARDAAPSTTSVRASWPSTGAGARQEGSANFLVRAWCGEERAWKPFWLMVFPPTVLAAGAASSAGHPVVASLAALAPWLPAALLGLLAVLCVAGAILLWRCAFNVDRRILGYLWRALSILALAGIGFAIYVAATGKLLRSAPASVSKADTMNIAANRDTLLGRFREERIVP